MQKQPVLKLGVIGAGRIGRLHAENIARRVARAELVAVADLNLAAAEALADDCGIGTAVADYRLLLADPAVEAVVICSATETHAPMITAAATAGKHIFCEKPIDHDLARIDDALTAVAAAGVKLQVGFNRRFDAGFRRAQAMVAAGKIGQPHILRITSRDPAPPPPAYVAGSGGIFLDMTIHDFDMARFLMGSEVMEVYATGGVLIEPAIGELGDLDTAVVCLTFANGGLGVIDNSRQAIYGYDQRVEVFGSAGMVTVGNRTPDSHVYSNAEGVSSARPLYFFLERYQESYVAEMQAFVDAVSGDREPPVGGRDGRAPVVIALAAGLSWREKRPVRVEEMVGKNL